jgi:hypothetical protein
MLISNKKLSAMLLIISAIISCAYYFIFGILFSEFPLLYSGYGILSLIIFGGLGTLIYTRSIKSHTSITISAIIGYCLSILLLLGTIIIASTHTMCIVEGSTICDAWLFIHAQLSVYLTIGAVVTTAICGYSLLYQK